jgi:tripartite-type tricarboxylate transporter receptor subunit TctC
MMDRRTSLKLAGLTATEILTSSAFAQEDKSPMTVLVGAASSMDFTARLVGDQLREKLNRTVVVSSKLGAGGRLALGELKRSAPDGNTVMFSTSSLFAIYPHIYTKLDYDPVADFTPICGLTWFDLGIATGIQSGIKDIAQWIASVKSQGSCGAVYGVAPGAGSSSHFLGIAMAQSQGLKMEPVHYKDSAVGLIDLASGRLPMLITGTSALVEMHRAKKVRMLAVSGEQRSELVPEVPTLKESGMNVAIQNSAGLFGPAKMSKELVEKIAAATMPMFQKPDVKAKLATQGMAISPMNAVQFANSLIEDRKKFEILARTSGYKPEAL